MWQILDDIPPGSLFETEDGVRAVKSEYHYDNHNLQPLCVLLASGEFAHFPDKERTRVRVIDLAAALRAAERAERDGAIEAVKSVANSLPADCDDGFYAGYELACRNALAAIRAAAATPAPAGDD